MTINRSCFVLKIVMATWVLSVPGKFAFISVHLLQTSIEKKSQHLSQSYFNACSRGHGTQAEHDTVPYLGCCLLSCLSFNRILVKKNTPGNILEVQVWSLSLGNILSLGNTQHKAGILHRDTSPFRGILQTLVYTQRQLRVMSFCCFSEKWAEAWEPIRYKV